MGAGESTPMVAHMNMKVIPGCILALLIGVLCRLSGFPLPAPIALLGGVLAMAMTVGYALVDRYAGHRERRKSALCGGPSGLSASERPRR